MPLMISTIRDLVSTTVLRQHHVCVAPSSGQSPRARGNQTQIDVSATQTTYRSVGTAAHFVPPVEP